MHVHVSMQKFLFVLSLILLCLMLATRHSPAQTLQPTRFTVVDTGTPNKPDLILIPGLNGSRAVWDAEAKLLAPNYRLHLVQVDGFAGQPAGPNATGSMLPAIVEELHTYIATNKLHPVVIGHSLGGLLALMLADKYPGDFRKLVIVDALPFYAVLLDPDATVSSITPQLAAMRAQMAGMPDDQYAAMQPMMAAALVKNPDGQKLVAAGSASSDRTVAVNAMIEDMETDLRPEMSSIQTPTLVLYPFEPGQRQGTDPAKTDAVYTTAFKSMPHATLHRIDDSRHFLMLDQPAAFDTALQAFIK